MALASFLVTAQTITGAHSNYRCLITAQNFLNANANALDGTTFVDGGGNLIVYTDATKTTRVPIEVVRFVTGGAPEVEIWALSPTMQSSATFHIEADDTQVTQPPVTDPFGRNAVWPNRTFVTHQEQVDVIDSSGNRANGTASANVVNVAGKYGRANRFNDLDTNISIPGVLDIIGDFTQSIWINTNNINTSFQGALGDWGASGSERDSYMGVTNGGDFNWDGFNTAANRRAGVVANEWQLWSVSRTGSTVGIYKNGVLQGATFTDAGDSSTGNANIYIGALGDGSSNFFSGDIGKIEVSNDYSSPDRLLVDFQNQDSPETFWTSSNWTTDGGTGIGVTITETLSTYLDQVSTDISVNVNVAVTESLGAYEDSSIVTAIDDVNVTSVVTESLSSYQDLSAADVSINVNANVTESLPSFADSINTNIQQQAELVVTELLSFFSDSSDADILRSVEVAVTETLSSYSDSAAAGLPIRISNKNAIRVSRQNKTVNVASKTVKISVKRNSRITRVR